MPKALLKVENLHKSYGDLTVLNGISFQVKQGDTTAVSYTHLDVYKRQP